MDSWEDELEALEAPPAPEPPKPVEAPAPAAAPVTAPAKATSVSSKLVLGKAKKAAPVVQLSAEEERERVLREIEASEADLASDMFGVKEAKKDGPLSAADAYGDYDEDDSKIANKQGTVLEDMSFKTVEDASQLAEQIANIVRAKTLKRDNLLMAFIKAFNNVAVDTLKIDDLSGVKDHITTIYTNRKNAKQQAKASVSSGKATTAKKSVGKINMYDAYGSEEVSGRGASGGQLSKDADDYDFM